jgi:hypothetical protein
VPEDGDAPRGLLKTEALEALGMTFGGRALFQETVKQLVAAVQGKTATSGKSAPSGGA